MSAATDTKIDLLDLRRFEAGVPHDWFTYLRREHPVYRFEAPDGSVTWLLSKHRDIQVTSRDWKKFSSQRERGGIMGLTQQERDLVALSAPENYLPLMDPPAHTKHRQVVASAMMPGSIVALEPAIRAIAERLLDDHVGSGPIEFVNDMAGVLPLEALAELGGIPIDDRKQMFAWANALALPDDPEYNPHPGSYQEARAGLMDYCRQLYRARKGRPGDDVVSRMIHGSINGVPTTEDQATAFFDILLAAGSETTRNTLSHAILAFLEFPEEYQALRSRPDLLAGPATEEVLRWATPIMQFRRTVMQPVELHDQSIQVGEGVALLYISGNRDEDVFHEPFRFDVDREFNPQLAFGGGGPHNCLGAGLARLQIRVFYEEFVRRVGRISQVGPPARVRSNVINGIKRLPVELRSA